MTQEWQLNPVIPYIQYIFAERHSCTMKLSQKVRTSKLKH